MKFSIVIAVFNGEKYLKKCLKSVLEQNYSDYEVIVVDDASTDATPDILRKYEKEEAIKVITNKKNQGVSISRNKGLMEAKGDWITFVDADDYIDNNYLAYVNHILKEEADADIIQNNLYVVNKKTKNQKILYSSVNDCKICSGNSSEILKNIITMGYGNNGIIPYGNCRCIGGKFYRRELLLNNNIHFPAGIKTFEDGIFNLYAYYYARLIIVRNDSFYYYLQHKDSTTGKFRKEYILQYRLVLKKIKEFINNYNLAFLHQSYEYCALSLFSKVFIELARRYTYAECKYTIYQVLHFSELEKSIRAVNFSRIRKRDKPVVAAVKTNNTFCVYIIARIMGRVGH